MSKINFGGGANNTTPTSVDIIGDLSTNALFVGKLLARAIGVAGSVSNESAKWISSGEKGSVRDSINEKTLLENFNYSYTQTGKALEEVTGVFNTKQNEKDVK